MTENRFKSTEFRAAIQEVVAKHLEGVTHIPSADRLLELAAEGVQAAIDAAIDEGDFKPAKGLEHVAFTEFAKLSVLVPQKFPQRENIGLKAYPLLSDNFLAEPFFKQFPTIAAVRKYMVDSNTGLDGLNSVRYEGQAKGLRYDRRAELAQLIHRTGLELLPGMVPFMEMGKGSMVWDRDNLRALLAQIASPQTRDMINDLLRDGEGDINYLYNHTPITRNLIMKHLKLGENEGVLDNAVGFRNSGSQVAAHLRFLLDFQHIGLRGGKPYLMPSAPKGGSARAEMISKKL